jgi:hypothetical protein
MSNSRKPTSALFPVRTEFPESRKMSENFDGNAAIYDFFDFLLERGYVLARREPESGQLRAMKVRPTVEHEVLMFRGVDKIAYAVERDAMRAAYPHLWARYGLSDETPIHDGVPEYADTPVAPMEPVQAFPPLDDDELVSVAEAHRRGVFKTPAYNGVRVKMTICRRSYPELMPKVTYRGSQTLYRVGDLKVWEDAYSKATDEKVRWGRSRGGSARAAQFNPGGPVPIPSLEQPVAEAVDALAFLMSKIRGGEEDVR